MKTYSSVVQESPSLGDGLERVQQRPFSTTLNPSSPEFTEMLVRCFVEARNAAIDENEAFLAGKMEQEKTVSSKTGVGQA